MSHYSEELTEFEFNREEIIQTANTLDVKLPKNLGDVIYSFRFRTTFPREITDTEPQGLQWTINLVGKGKYKFILSKDNRIIPSPHMVEVKIPDSTPGLITLYSYSDEQALLAILRYNRLLDVFTGKTCYSLQNHMRTSVSGIGQIETDEIYVGIDQDGNQYVFPVQAKGHNDQIGIVQIEQDMAMCHEKFSQLNCIPIAAQFLTRDTIAMFSFVSQEEQIRLVSERHYKLVPAEDQQS